MKSINVYFEDKEYWQLMKVKGDKSWKELIMTLIKKEVEEE